MALWIKILVTYLIVANIIGCVAAHADKRKAIQHKWRTPEKAFWLIALAGGGAGVLLGFVLFHHKTKHTGLVFAVALCTMACYVAIYCLFTLLRLPY